MTEKEAFDVMKRCVNVALEYFKLDWTVTYQIAPLPGNMGGRNTWDVDYNQSTITIDHHKLRDLEEVYDTTAHEMAHLVTAEWALAENILKANHRLTKADLVALTHAYEKPTVRIGNLLSRERPFEKNWPEPKKKKPAAKRKAKKKSEPV